MKDEDYLVHNLNKIAQHLEHINWNLGKILGVMLKDKKLISDIEKTENEKKNAEEHGERKND